MQDQDLKARLDRPVTVTARSLLMLTQLADGFDMLTAFLQAEGYEVSHVQTKAPEPGETMELHVKPGIPTDAIKAARQEIADAIYEVTAIRVTTGAGNPFSGKPSHFTTTNPTNRRPDLSVS